MDTKICDDLNNIYNKFNELNTSNSTIFDKEYKDTLVDIYTTLYNTEKKYNNSECSKVINNYLEDGSSEYERYRMVNEDSLTLQKDQHLYNIYKVISILASVGLIYLMQ